jgi:hypothetical protein
LTVLAAVHFTYKLLKEPQQNVLRHCYFFEHLHNQTHVLQLESLVPALTNHGCPYGVVPDSELVVGPYQVGELALKPAVLLLVRDQQCELRLDKHLPERLVLLCCEDGLFAGDYVRKVA